ncbi:MAG: alpha-L-fucosidase [Spirochaetaceae bacterium]|jgi:alpha-L-fucosidase|nr:alpha-L-fucosidase [Spirochaetaceae bacterium]
MNDLEMLKAIDAVIAQGPYRSDWESLSGNIVPAWFRDAKFGLFVHWGVFSVPAFANEWYPRNMYIKDDPAYAHHRKTYGAHKHFGYKDFIPLFTMERFEPSEWAELFKESGARYVVPVAEHHDGFQLYRSALSHYNAAEMGPRRDLLGDLKRAVEEAGIIFGASSHRAEHWFFLGHGRDFDSDIQEPLNRGDLYWPSVSPEPSHQDLRGEPCPSPEYLTDWLFRTVELIDRYRPRLLYFDWWVQHAAFKENLKKALAYYRNRAAQWKAEVTVCTKFDAAAFGASIVEIERGKFAQAKPFVWQTETPVAKNSWSYTKQNQYKKSSDIVRELADVVSKNGNLLLNIGPTSCGIIPPEDERIIRDIGGWLKVNGEAIFGSTVWKVQAEGPTQESEGQFQDNESPLYTEEDFRFTARGGAIYAIALQYPKSGTVRIRSFSHFQDPKRLGFHGLIKDLSILGSKEKPEWSVTDKALIVSTKSVSSDFPIVIKITVE